MRKIILLSIVLVLSLISPAFAYNDEIIWQNIPWLSSVDTTKNAIAERLTTDNPTDEYNIEFFWSFNLNFPMYSHTHSFQDVQQVPYYCLTYDGNDPYIIAGYDVDRIELKFVPIAENGTYTNIQYDDYQFVWACYYFDLDGDILGSSIYDGLLQKLTFLYGDPTDKYDSYSTKYNSSTTGVYWIAEKDTYCILEYYGSRSVSTLTLTYAYYNYSFMYDKSNIRLDNGPVTADNIGDINGL